MIDFKICRNCSHGTFQPPEPGDDKRRLASVVCDLVDDDLLLMNSHCPADCPFALEHKLTTQAVPPSFANYMSGHRRRKVEAEF